MPVPSVSRRVAWINRIGLVVAFALVAASCGDSPIGIEPPESVQFDYSYPIDPPIFDDPGLPGGTPDCDPLTAVLPCDGGGGGGGGGGTVAPDVARTCPNCRAFTKTEMDRLVDATEHICSTYRQGVKNALTVGEYGAAFSDYAKRGNYWTGYPTGSDYRYSINMTHHPGFTGKMETPPRETIGPTQQLIELAGTLVHEYFHKLFPSVGDEGPNGIKARTKSCVAGLIGPR